MIFFIALFLLIALIYFIIQYSFLIPTKKGIPVLMYHKIHETEKDMLTVSAEDFEKQLKFLKDNDYQAITTKELLNFLDNKQALPPNPVLITFDDGYVSNLELAYPLLQKYHLKATIFLPTSYLGGMSSWYGDGSALMTYEQLKSLNSSVIEFGLHSHKHQNFKHLALEEMREELLTNMQTLTENGIDYTPTFAYPYGGRPKKKEVLNAMKKMFTEIGIKAAFRIGNKVNSFKSKDKFELKRIDIQGNDSFWSFKTKLQKGRVKLF
jgi:peptidoglycan/xylan/chitin deacetylase (PgdA/CDA1 family)